MLPYRKRRRAMTLVEMSISVAVFTFVGLFVAYVSLLIARQSKETLSQIPAQEQAYRAVDVVRQRLLMANFDSILLSTDQRMITFQNPYRANPSTLEFDSNTRQIIFVEDTSRPSNQIRWGRNVQGRFEYSMATPKLVRIHVSTTAYGRNNQPLTISFSEEITVRN